MINELSLNNSEYEILRRNGFSSLGQCCGFVFLFSSLSINALIFMCNVSRAYAAWGFQVLVSKLKFRLGGRSGKFSNVGPQWQYVGFLD